jgi:hypothetical protein
MIVADRGAGCPDDEGPAGGKCTCFRLLQVPTDVFFPRIKMSVQTYVSEVPGPKEPKNICRVERFRGEVFLI